MIEWVDAAFVIAVRRHGESGLIVELLTSEHGRHLGFVRGGQSPKRRSVLQPGNAVAATWRGRLPEHLGTLGCELLRANAAPLLDRPDALAALASATALLAVALPEREPHADVFAGFAALLAALDSALDWSVHYVRWECDLLAALGFGLELTHCAATGATRDLVYVSPRTGRAVSREAGRPYHDKLLPLPEFLQREAAASKGDVAAGLSLTGHFLRRHLLQPQGRTLPAARTRFAARMEPGAAADKIGQAIT